MFPVRFSIVIPTRNGAETLSYTLQTCLSQAFDSFEIIVSDNCSQPATRRVVDSFGSEKIKYTRSEVPLAMSDNWELALSHAVGEYVILIGDDDGMLPNALTDLDLFIAKTQARAIRWQVATYLWPDVQRGLAANKIHIPIPAQTLRIDSHQAIKSVLSGRNDYSFLPMVYYSAIHQDLIQDLKSRTGKIFQGSNPDIYSSFAIGYLAKTHYLLGKPISIVGHSGRSNGIAYMNAKEQTSIIWEFHRLNESAGYFFDKQIPNIPSMGAVVANEFLHVKQALFPQDDQFVLDRKQVIVNSIKALEDFNRVGEKEWDEFMHIIEASLMDDKDLQDWFRETFVEHYEPKGRPWKFSQEAWRDGLTRGYLNLDGKEFGVSDVFDASVLCGKFINQAILFTDHSWPRFWLGNRLFAGFRLFQIVARIKAWLRSLLFAR